LVLNFYYNKNKNKIKIYDLGDDLEMCGRLGSVLIWKLIKFG